MGVDPWALAKITRDSLPSAWTSHHESMAELLHKLFCATWELEALKSSIEEERKEREENINQLIQILKSTTQQRDEAREQLQFLLNKISEPNFLPELFHSLSHLYPHSPQIWEPRGNSMVIESEGLPETRSHQSHGSSPVASFHVASKNRADSCTMGLPQKPFLLGEKNHSSPTMISPGTAKYDRADAIIDILSKKKPLPEKGKLLETMLKIGPTLETPMVAGGPLPHWRNPPPLQSIQVPPVTIKARYAQLLNRAAFLHSNHWTRSSLHEKSNGLSKMQAASILGFSGKVSSYGRTLPRVGSNRRLEPKRERTQ